jgi:hypothetical protein
MKKLGKGMFKDTALVDQPEGTMRDALNANLNDKKGSISNEWGTTEFPTNADFRVLGRAVLDDDKIVMFGQDVFNTVNADDEPIVIYTDQIRILDTRNQEVIILYENDALNFQQSHPIVTTHRKNQAGEYLVYFTDGYEVEEEIYDGFNYVTDYNPPRVINVTKQLEWVLSPTGGFDRLYSPRNSHHKLQLIPRVGFHTTFQSATIIEGGTLTCAAYYLALAYADEDGLETNYFVVSNPVYIAPGPENVLPTNSFIGAEGGTVTSKAIQWQCYVPPGVDYEMLQPAVMKLEKSALTAVKLPAKAIVNNSGVVITYSGTEDVSTIATDDILIDDINYITADTINQLDNRLYLGNVATNKDIGFQPFAWNIMVDAVVEEVPRFDPRLYDTYILNSGYAKLMQAYFRNQGQQYDEVVDIYPFQTPINADEPPGEWNVSSRQLQDGYAEILREYITDTDGYTSRKGYRSPAYSFQNKSYRRGEVYAFYISFVLNDGTETYAYHIPGRPRMCMPFEGSTASSYDEVEWYKVTVTQAVTEPSPSGFGPDLVFTTVSEYVFAYVSSTAVPGYSAGYYNSGASHNTRVGQFDNDTLPGTLSLVSTPADTTQGFVGTTGFTSGTAPTGDLLSWINTYGTPLVPATPPATSDWVSVSVQTKSPGTIWEESESTVITEEAGELCESDLMRDYSYNANASAHGFRPEEMLDADQNLSVYQVVDTSDRVDSPTGMGYWENKNEVYPETPDFLLGQVNPDGTTSIGPGQNLYGQQVRHHKMPSNLTDRGFMPRRITEVQGSNVLAEETIRINAQTQYGRTQTPEAQNANGYLLTAENISILGIKLRNVKIPRSILGQVQGYKIYYAKREQKDRTILGQSLAIPGHPRYGASPKQSLEDAVSGPFIKAFYMYGGLDHTDNSTIFTLGKWKGAEGEMVEGRRKQEYLAHPVFKFHDFGMLRNRTNLSAVTHIQCQYGVAFRQYAGGPGVFVKPCEYSKIWNAPYEFGSGAQLEAKLNIYNSPDLTGGGLHTAHSTTFPSLGWVSPQMRNTVDFYWHDPRWESDDAPTGADILGYETRVLDISDKDEGEVNTIFGGNGNGEFQSADQVHDDGSKAASRVKARRSGLDGNQPADDATLVGPEKLLAVKAKEARIRAWWTSAMIGTVYMSPRVVLESRFVIKGGDRKEWGADEGVFDLRNWYKEEFNDNQLTLAVEPGGKILLHGRDDHRIKDSASFKGVDMLFNRAGETAHAFSLVSGLPALRGHLPIYNNALSDFESLGARSGLTRWGEAINYLYPDAAIDGVPLAWKKFNLGAINPLNDYETHNPNGFRGLSYSLQQNNNNYGLPMAWLVNICAVRTDVFNPFDRQNLVWTGYYHKIFEPDLSSGEADDFEGNISDYYNVGGESRNIFGGDTYISKYSFRTTSQSYGHSYFRASWTKGDALGAGQPDEDAGYITYLNTEAITTKRDRFQGDIPATLDPRKWGIWNGGDIEEQPNPVPNRFGTTGGFPVWAWNYVSANIASDDFDGNAAGSAFTLAERALDVLQDSRNWVKGNVNPVSTVFTFMCETDDLIGFRHVDDEEKGEDTMFFDYNSANKVIFSDPTNDFTKPDKLLYGEHYSALQDKKVTFPLPVYGELAKVQRFPNRVVRSDVDSGSLADGYRKFRALEYKDIPAHRGDIMNLFDLQGNLYIHTERSLFVTKGKEELQLSAVTAFIGSGNIFVQDPDESMQADAGHGGTTSRHAHVTTPYGHFYVNYRDRKVYSVTQGIQDITAGMETWLRDNIPFVVEQYGINLDSDDARNNGFFLDATTGVNVPLGFTLGYDPLFKRILITKHEPVPTQQFLEDFWAGNIVIENNIPVLISACSRGQKRQFKPLGTPSCGPVWFGNPRYFTQRTWTISYYPEMQVWGSRHSYGPNLYTNTSEYMISFANNGTWEHSNELNPGRFYGTTSK